MGYKLYREIKRNAPAEWDSGMRLVAMAIADEASEDTRRTYGYQIEGSARPTGRYRRGICDDTGLTVRGVQDALQRLAKAGAEFRVPISMDKNGRPVFAVKGRATDYRVPSLTAQSPRRSEPIDEAKGTAQRGHKDAYGHAGASHRARRSVPPDPQIPSDEYSSDARDDEQIVIGIFAALGEDIDRDGAKRVIEALTGRAGGPISDLNRYASTCIRKDPARWLRIAREADIEPWARGERSTFEPPPVLQCARCGDRDFFGHDCKPPTEGPDQ